MEMNPEVTARLEAFQPEQRTILADLRRMIHEWVPHATELNSWGMPTYRLAHDMFLHFHGFTHHNSVFPGSGTASALKEKYGPLIYSKGTFRFPVHEPIPPVILKEIIETRIQLINDTYPKKNGVYRRYAMNGALIETGKFNEGEKHGMWSEYDEQGHKIATSKFKNGTLIHRN